MQKHNLLKYQPILVNEGMVVIDGQHRIEAAKMIEEPVYYVKVPNISLQEVRLLNENMKAWTIRDFAESYAKTGNDDYQYLIDFSDTYHIPLSTSASLLSGSMQLLGGGQISTAVRNGTFKVKERANAEETARRINEIKPFADSTVWRDREFIRALVKMYQNGMHQEELLEKLKSNNENLRKMADYREYMLWLQDVYNYNRRKNRVEVL